jgi:hypothetical protein
MGGSILSQQLDGLGIQTANEVPPARHHPPVAKLSSAKFKTPKQILFGKTAAVVVRRLQLENLLEDVLEPGAEASAKGERRQATVL